MEKYVIVCGTNRNDSVSFQIAQIYQELLRESARESDLIDLKELPPDFAFTALYEKAGTNPNFNKFREQMEAADKFVFYLAPFVSIVFALTAFGAIPAGPAGSLFGFNPWVMDLDIGLLFVFAAGRFLQLFFYHQ